MLAASAEAARFIAMSSRVFTSHLWG
jgi:hypothetical protein